MRRLRHLTGQHRTPYMNRLLGGLLAFNAGAINAGGFLVVGMYTWHMTGFASLLADNLVLGHMTLVLGAVGALLAFTTAVLVNWARQNHLRSEYALPLLLEAVLMLLALSLPPLYADFRRAARRKAFASAANEAH